MRCPEGRLESAAKRSSPECGRSDTDQRVIQERDLSVAAAYGKIQNREKKEK